MINKCLIFLGVFVFASAVIIAGCNSKTVEQLCTEAVQQIQASNPGGAIVLLKNALEKDPNNFNARYQLAKAYAVSGKYEQAEKEFQKVIRQNPGRDEIKLELARVQCSFNKPESAIPLANEYLKNHPGSADALEILGIANFISKKLDEAENYLLQALQSNPSSASAKLELAQVYFARKYADKSRNLLTEVISSDPSNSKAYYLLAAIESATGNRPNALEIYNKLAVLNPTDPTPRYKTALILIENGEIGKAEKIADELITKYPKRADGFRLRGICSFYMKKFKDAVTDLQQSIKIQPTVEGVYFLGLSLYNTGELESALSQFRIIIDRTPTFIQARLMSAVILLSQKRTDDSISELSRILQMDNKNPLAHNLLGSAYMAKGMPEDGLKEYNTALELNPKLAEAYIRKGIYYLNRGNANEAETELRTAVAISPEIIDSRLILFSYYMRHNEPDKAFALARAGIKGNKSDAILYNCMAAVMFSKEKPTDAIGYLQKAKISDPGFYVPYFNMATYYASSGSYDKALNEFTAVLQKDPKNVKAMLGSAAILELTGKDKEAVNWYERAKSTNDPSAFITMASYYARKKETGKAISVIDDAIKSIPRNPDFLEFKGRLYLSEKKYREAIKTFDDLESISPDRGIPLKITTYVAMKEIPKAIDQARRVITLKPNSANGYIILASIFENQNDLDRAINELKNGLEREKDSIPAMLKLGNLYIAKKNYQSASTTFADAIRKNPDSPAALFSQGSLLEMTGSKKEAIHYYRLALSKSGDYLPALNNLSYLYSEGYGDRKEGLRMAISAFKQEPGNAGVMDTLGYALLKNGRAEESRKVLEKAASILSDNPTVQYHLALAYRDSGNKQMASAALRKALQKGNFPEEKDARKLLTQIN